jgi:predicted DNA-binding transcriptional regulator YafY
LASVSAESGNGSGNGSRAGKGNGNGKEAGNANASGQRRPDSTQLVRQWAILRLLAESGRSFTARDLAEQLGTSKTTIQRDLATLGQQFALIEELVGKQKKVYRIDASIRALETLTFGPAELLALHAAQGALRGLAGTPIYDDLQSVTRKLRGFLSPRHNGGLDQMARVFLPHKRGYVDYGDHSDVIDDLGDASARRLVCTIVYHAAWRGTTREHRIKPLRLVWHRAALYLLAQIVDRAEITTFAVHRIQALELTGESFTAPRVDLAAHISRAFGIFVSDEEQDVEILFSPEIAWRIEERVYHPKETKERLPDGRLRYRVRSSAQWEILPWVQAFGSLAELVAPPAWREELAATSRGLLEIYGDDDDPDSA